ncbi:MAG: hypothetical protein RR355_00860 [Oscillospiraceae bacterium]
MSNKNEKDNLKNAAIIGGTQEQIQKYGSAVKEHIVSYTGVDNETNRVLKKSLKSIAEQKVNPNYKQQNLRQQAGFSAEVKDTANYNAESIIKKSPTQKIRTDDLGSVNDPLFDHVQIDSGGNVISGSASQMKFVGNTPKEALDKLASKKFAKYLDNNVKIEVPSDYYEGILKEASTKIGNLENQVQEQLKKGNTERVKQLKKQINDYETIKKNLQKSSVSNKEAMFARNHPKLSTVKSVAQVSHRAGLETAGESAIIGGSISIVQNIVSLMKDEISTEEAFENVAKETVSASVIGYGTGFVGSTIKGMLQNSSSSTTQALAKTNLPSTVVMVAISATKTMNSYFKGDINGVQCFEQLGEQGTGMISSALFAAIGQTFIPIPFVGGLIGSMIGYAISSASYGIFLSFLKEAKLAKEERLQIEKACAEHIKLIKEYRIEMEQIIQEYFVTHIEIFHKSFENIKDALKIGNIDGFIDSTNNITKKLGGTVLFETQKECDDLMLDNNSTIKI